MYPNDTLPFDRASLISLLRPRRSTSAQAADSENPRIGAPGRDLWDRGVPDPPTLISNVTEAILEEVKAWQSRPLEELYPIVYLDAMMVKIRDSGHVQNQAIYVVLGVDLAGQKEVLGLWTGQQEGAKFWLQVLTEL